MGLIDSIIQSEGYKKDPYLDTKNKWTGGYGHLMLAQDWLHNGADIPTYSKDRETNLISQLTSMEYFYNSKMQIQLLAKKDLKKMGYESPDIADSLALTFGDAIFETKSRLISRPIKQARFMWV